VKDPRHVPTEIGPTADGRRLRLRWKDGHVSELTPWELRVACPCAGCVDEMTGRRTLEPESVDSGVHPMEIVYVGRYALGFRWSDGHETGIYPFEYLRRLCRCGECAPG
jgi:DUF971 family protein